MNLNEYCAPDGHIISPYLRCMMKGALKDQIESAISEFHIPEVAKSIEAKVKKRVKNFLNMYGREHASLGVRIDTIKCLNIIDDQLFMISLNFNYEVKYVVAWYDRNTNTPKIKGFDNYANAKSNLNNLKNGLMVLD